MKTTHSARRRARMQNASKRCGTRPKVPVLLAKLAVLGLFLVSSAANAAEPDYSTPMAAAKSFLTAMTAGDGNRVKSACLGTCEQQEMIVMFMRGCLASGKFDAAARAKFGPEETLNTFNDDLQQAGARIPKTLAALTNCEMQIDGTNATITFSPAKSGSTPLPIKLRKVGGQWKVLLEMDVAKVEPSTDLMEAMASSMETCAAEITAGKFQTAAEAQQAQRSAMHAQYLEKKKGASDARRTGVGPSAEPKP